jgi:hypothetical protein
MTTGDEEAGTMTWTCPNGHQVLDYVPYCPHDPSPRPGGVGQPAVWTCPKGHKVPGNYCTACGAVRSDGAASATGAASAFGENDGTPTNSDSLASIDDKRQILTWLRNSALSSRRLRRHAA